MGPKTITTESRVTADQSAAGESFLESAKIEFQACLQLLAERARFLSRASAVGVALFEQDQFRYCAASGESAPAIGPCGEIEELRHSLLNGEPVLGRDRGSEQFLLVPIGRNAKIVGFFKLWGKDLGARELQSIERLGEMAATAIDHLEAAEKSGQIVTQGFRERPSLETAPTPHSGEHLPLPPGFKRELGRAAGCVHSCRSCGFPVSDRRSLCVDCEEHALSSSPAMTMPLFESPPEESWLREHLYTIATLVVTALAAAAIYWLR
jgi:hypothetical protein